MARVTVVLTDRPPVKVAENAWPILSESTASWHDGDAACTANRKSAWSLAVRQHADGRALVYGSYEHTTWHESERDYHVRRGVLLPPGTGAIEIVQAIRSVASAIAEAECVEVDRSRWQEVAQECIAGMPAEALD